MMTKREALKHFPTQTALAEALGVTLSACSQWGMDDPLPEMRELQLRYEIIPALKAQKAKRVTSK